jgi:hypothetical protein
MPAFSRNLMPPSSEQKSDSSVLKMKAADVSKTLVFFRQAVFLFIVHVSLVLVICKHTDNSESVVNN